ncbi:MAG: 2-oxoacid:ferredoxin oxidoreductase subunit gamma, partial [Thermodesulfobacteriota bacterium]
LSQLTGLVSRRALEKALLKRVPLGTEVLNRKALSAGVKLAKDFNQNQATNVPPEMDVADV